MLNICGGGHTSTPPAVVSSVAQAKQLNAGTTLVKPGGHPWPGQEHRERPIRAPRRVVSAMLFGSTEQGGRRELDRGY